MTPALDDSIRIAVEAALSKQAEEVVVLDVSKLCSFASRLLICHGQSRRQVQTIADEIGSTLRENGVRPHHVEGEGPAEWVLMDYVDFVVHVFQEDRRHFFSLERLWGDAPRLPTGSAGSATPAPGARA